MENSSTTIPLVSWILCTNVNDQLLHRAIASCLNQSFTNFELVIVTNGKNYAVIAKALEDQYSHDRRVRIYSSAIQLLNFNLTLAAHFAKAPLLARMDADDVSYPTRLEKQVAFMEKNPEVGVLGTNYELIDSALNSYGTISLPLTNQKIKAALNYKNPLCHPSTMIRKVLIEEFGGYIGGESAEDYDLWVRVFCNSTWQFANLDEILLGYNIDPNGANRRSKKAYASVSSAQWRSFVLTKNAFWLGASLLTLFKQVLMSNKA